MHFYKMKDFIDLSPPDNGTENGENVTAADVCLYGLNIIMPLMSAELLKFPNLCLQYFRTITFVCEIYPEKVHYCYDDYLLTMTYFNDIR